MPEWTVDHIDQLDLGCSLEMPIDMIADMLKRDVEDCERQARIMRLRIIKREEVD